MSIEFRTILNEGRGRYVVFYALCEHDTNFLVLQYLRTKVFTGIIRIPELPGEDIVPLRCATVERELPDPHFS